MKKFSGIILSFLCLLVMCFSFAGCSNAEKASLIDISNKYEKISTDNEKIFNGGMFNPTYENNDLTLIINSSNEKYNVLKTDNNLTDYSSRGAYGILMQAINSTKLKSNALTVTANNKKISKKYRVSMYEGLEDLEKDIKNLNKTKNDLESIFETDNRDAEVVANQDLTLYSLNNYVNNLNKCLKDLLKFNKNYYNAIINNFTKPMSINDLLYNKSISSISKEDINQLINNANLLMSEFILYYNVDVCSNVNQDAEIITMLTKLLNIQFSLEDKLITNETSLNDYKIIRTMEESLNKGEISFNNAINGLTKENIKEDNNAGRIEFIETYKQNLISYANKLIKFLNEI